MIPGGCSRARAESASRRFAEGEEVAVLADEIDAVFKKCADGRITATVTVKQKNKETNKDEEISKEMTYPLYAKAKVKLGKKNADEWLKTVESGIPLKLLVDEGTVTEISVEWKKG
jgi:hypothetical protein